MTLLFDIFSIEGLIFILLATLVILILIIIDKRKSRMEKESGKNMLKSMDEIIAKYGEPDDVIIIDPTCGNDVNGTVINFKEKSLLIISGTPVEKQHIKDVSFSNFAIAYLPNDYKIIFLTDIPSLSVIRVPLGAGNEAHYANQVVKDIKSLL